MFAYLAHAFFINKFAKQISVVSNTVQWYCVTQKRLSDAFRLTNRKSSTGHFHLDSRNVNNAAVVVTVTLTKAVQSEEVAGAYLTARALSHPVGALGRTSDVALKGN